MSQRIELLSPAKNLTCGIEAVNHGADAIYIGSPQFGARLSAGNSLQDIEALIKYAHVYGVKVYITLNTILNDAELETAQALIYQLYAMGSDAIIIQDMGILEIDLPPIALHASTQTNNRSLEKIRFLETAGFQRVILARELSLQKIKDIRSQTKIELEAFVHGALCVSYSGQCYMSQYACQRSANRGECAQFCRLPYTLYDSEKNILLKDKHLLSLKDLDRSDALQDMLDAGISSFKIEGRLKEVDYVKNITAFYRQKLDALLTNNSEKYQSASSGKSIFYFTPNPVKTFHRGKINYFLYEREDNIIQAETPKSMGEKIGQIGKVAFNYIELLETNQLHPGDGLCFMDVNGEFAGFRINKIENQKIFPAKKIDVQIGTMLYRNYDAHFDHLLQGKSAERKIAIDIVLEDTDTGIRLHFTDEDNNSVEIKMTTDKIIAEKKDLALNQIQTQLQKLGDTVFKANNIEINTKDIYFIPNSHLANSRREGIQLLLEKRLSQFPQIHKNNKANKLVYPEKELSYLGNVMNKKAELFYKKAGIEHLDSAFEKLPPQHPILMQTKHCIKYSLGWCPKQKSNQTLSPKEPLYIQSQNNVFKLSFHCDVCEMHITPCT